MKKIAIIGISGYSGLELLRLLHSHPDAEIINVYGTSNIGVKLTDLFPSVSVFLNKITKNFKKSCINLQNYSYIT